MKIPGTGPVWFVIVGIPLLALCVVGVVSCGVGFTWLEDLCARWSVEIKNWGGNAMKSRAPIERMTKMYALIRSSKKFTAFDFAEMFEVSHKTIIRDLEFMRDRIGLPLIYDSSNFSWTTDSTVRLPWWLEINNAETL